MRTLVREHRLVASVGAGAIVAVVAWLAFGVFGVHLLFVDERVAEHRPAAATAEATGSFVSLEHTTTGSAEVLAVGDGERRILRLEDLDTSNGPDLSIFLVNSDRPGISDSVDLGELKGNQGDQNYAIPDGTDLDRYDTVLIWCVRFSAPFGEAPLAPV